jgi:hypothetical protein
MRRHDWERIAFMAWMVLCAGLIGVVAVYSFVMAARS